MDQSDVPLVPAQDLKNEPFDTFYCEPTFAMAPKTLEILNNGLKIFSKTIKTQKEALTLRLS